MNCVAPYAATRNRSNISAFLWNCSDNDDDDEDSIEQKTNGYSKANFNWIFLLFSYIKLNYEWIYTYNE